VPNSIAVKAADIVTFDGQGSVDSDGEIIEFEWRVGGFNLDKTGIASCDEIGNQTQITCRFAIPGSHIVSLAAIDNDGAKSVQASNVVVSMQGGYIGVVLQYGEKIKDTKLYREMVVPGYMNSPEGDIASNAKNVKALLGV
jgi:hypothetical protein